MDISRQIVTYVRKFKLSDLQGSMPDTPYFIVFSFGYSSADPEEGTGGPDPHPPWEITSYMGFYRE